MAKKKAVKTKPKAPPPEEKPKDTATENLAGKPPPKEKKKHGGTRPHSGPKAKWEPEEGQRFTIQDVMERGLQSRDLGDGTDKDLAKAKEYDRQAQIMFTRLEKSEINFLVEAIVNGPFNAAEALTKWGGFPLKPKQESWLVKVWEPFIRFYVPYYLARWGHLALPILLSIPVVAHKVKGYGEYLIEVRKSKAAAVDHQRQNPGGKVHNSP